MSVIYRRLAGYILSLAHGDKSKETIIICMMAALAGNLHFHDSENFRFLLLLIMNTANVLYMYIMLIRINGIQFKGNEMRLILIGVILNVIIHTTDVLIVFVLSSLLGEAAWLLSAAAAAFSIYVSGTVFLLIVFRQK